MKIGTASGILRQTGHSAADRRLSKMRMTTWLEDQLEGQLDAVMPEVGMNLMNEKRSLGRP